jgi:hypothetical protein
LQSVEEFVKKMSGFSVHYKDKSVPGFTIANIVEKTITAYLSAGVQLPELANALQLAIYEDDVQQFIKLSFRPPMLKTMESYFISYCPDHASETKTLNQWFDGRSKNNIAPIYLLW